MNNAYLDEILILRTPPMKKQTSALCNRVTKLTAQIDRLFGVIQKISIATTRPRLPRALAKRLDA